MKTIHFISGLPRSGSTLLCNLLAQNPDFHATATSGILEILYQMRTNWDSVTEFRAMDETESDLAKHRVMLGALTSYFNNIPKPIVFDKSRGWCAYIEMAEEILQRKVKVLVPVRDVRDVLVSFEKLWRKETGSSQIITEKANFYKFQTLAGRCEVWCQEGAPVGLAYNRVKDAVTRGLGDRLLFVEYERLTSTPGTVMSEIYNFLDKPLYNHDFENVEQVTQENDRVHGFKDLHTIRHSIAPQPSSWPEVLGEELGLKYSGLNFWRD